jgi:hypothetical protein
MIESYTNFFIASTEASAAFIGLLFVAVSFIDRDDNRNPNHKWQRTVANSSFAQLVNVFFVSLVGLLPHTQALPLAGIITAVLGLLLSFKMLIPTLKQTPDRHGLTLLGFIAPCAYLLELITSFILLRNSNNDTLMSYLILAIVILYVGALARAWEITGVRSN